MVLVCSAIRSLILPISRCTASAATAAVVVREDPAEPVGVETVGVLAAERSFVGVET